MAGTPSRASPFVDALTFASAWAEAWNKRDLDAVLDNFAEDCLFFSPKSQAFGLEPPIRGKEALRAYWVKALAAHRSDLKFEVEMALLDEKSRAITIIYESHHGHDRVRAVEIMHFDSSGLVSRSEALYGVVVWPE